MKRAVRSDPETVSGAVERATTSRRWSFRSTVKISVSLACFGTWLVGCSRPISENALVVTQVPRGVHKTSPQSEMDSRYPPGSRVILTSRPPSNSTRVLSAGLIAAGEPVISHDGHRIVFVGKRAPDAEWQIYETSRERGGLKELTFAKGGAKDPALLADGTLIYISPADRVAGTRLTAQLYTQRPAATARQLTFCPVDVAEPTILADGRILFVSSDPNQSTNCTSLFTINNDGTEITAFCGQHEVCGFLHRPRELGDNRVVFISGAAPGALTSRAEFVSMARPFTSRSVLFANTQADVSCVQLAASGDWIVCARPAADNHGNEPFTVFAVRVAAAGFDNPLLRDSQWESIEAIPAAAGQRPMGRLSNVDPSHRTGQILCLNINETTMSDKGGTAKTVRIVTSKPPAGERVLGHVDVQADGSFMAEVPADVPLGFEALDETGTVLRREAPFMWVRPGENRACIGCHEPHNHSPRNLRPMAARVPVPRVTAEPKPLARAP
jgi:hypothetical protein